MNKKNKSRKRRNLKGKVSGIISLGGMGMGLLFLSPMITGNAVGGLGTAIVNWIGVVLWGIGLIAGFFWMKDR